MSVEFSANLGCLEHLQKKKGIVLKNVCSEANNVLPTMTIDWLHSMLLSILEEFDLKNVCNANETGLFYHCLPKKTLSFKGQLCSGEKISKERITVLIECNSDWSEKLLLFTIIKSLKLQCFKNVRSLPVEYTMNKNHGWQPLYSVIILSMWISNFYEKNVKSYLLFMITLHTIQGSKLEVAS